MQRKTRAAVSCFIQGCTVLTAMTSMAQSPKYAVIQLAPPTGYDTCYALALNNAGEVAGNLATGGYYKNSFYWKSGTGMVVIPLIAPATYSRISQISASGEVLGYMSPSVGAYVWSNGKPPAALTFPGVGVATANWINNVGQIVGSGALHPYGVDSNGKTLYASGALLWERDASGTYGVGGELPSLAGDNSAAADRVNNTGSIIGRSWKVTIDASGGTLETQQRLVRWTKDATSGQWIPSILPQPISGATSWQVTVQNDAGAYAGQYTTSLGQSAFYVSSPASGATFSNLGNLGHGYATRPNGLNESGQVAGSSTVVGQKGNPNFRAFYWSDNLTGMLNLGTLGGTESRAEGDNVFHGLSFSVINSSGWITGYSTIKSGTYHAYVWVPTLVNGAVTGGTMYDLNSSSVTSNLGKFSMLNGAAAINDNGLIIGYGQVSISRNTTQSHGFVAVPL